MTEAELTALEADLKRRAADGIGSPVSLRHELTLVAMVRELQAEVQRLRECRSDPPWLAELHAALGVQGGTIHQALNKVREMQEVIGSLKSITMTDDAQDALNEVARAVNL